MTTSVSAQPPEPRALVRWRRGRLLAHLAAALRGIVVRPAVVRRAVLVRTIQREPQWQVSVLPFLRRGVPLVGRVRELPSLAERTTLWEVGCLPGAESTTSETIRQACERIAGDAQILTCPIPPVRYESGDGQAVIELMEGRQTPSKSSGRGVCIGIVDTELKGGAIPGAPVVAVRRPDATRAKYRFVPATDKPWHGVAVTAVIARNAPEATLVFVPRPTDVKFWLTTALSLLEAEADKMDQPLVVNLSLSMDTTGMNERGLADFDRLIEGEMHDATARMLIIASAGTVNPGQDRTVRYVARCHNVVAVCALNSAEKISSRSATGKGDAPWSPWCSAPGGYDANDVVKGLVRRSGTVVLEGTSAACALASAFAACLIERELADGWTWSPYEASDLLVALSKSLDPEHRPLWKTQPP